MNELLPAEDWHGQDPAPQEHLARCAAVVIGVGEIGLQLAIQLARLGMPRLTLLDDDLVQEQGLDGRESVISRICLGINPALQIAAHRKRFFHLRPGDLPVNNNLVMFCASPWRITRRLIWANYFPCALFYCDGRMSAEMVRIIAVDDPIMDTHYPSTLSGAEELWAVADSADAASKAAVTAGLMIRQIAAWLRGETSACDFTVRLQTPEDY